MDSGATAGLVVGLLVFFCCCCCWCRRQCSSQSSGTTTTTTTYASLPGEPGHIAVDVSPVLRINRINLVLVCDRSGSMGGKRWADLCRGVQQAIDALTDGDVVTVVSFNNDVEAYGPDVKARFDLRPFLAHGPSGGTALYDATITALLGALKLHAAVDATTAMSTLTYVVVMTDGEDTSSRTSITDVQAVLQRINRLRNFKVVFAGVDLPPSGVSAIARLVAVGDSDISFLNLRDGFGGVFEHVCIALQARAVAR